MLPPLHNCSGGGGEKDEDPIYTPPPGPYGKGGVAGGGANRLYLSWCPRPSLVNMPNLL